MSVTVTRLDNGLIVVSDQMPELESLAVGLWVNAGTRHEAQKVMGISHMLEHMAFKGTERRSARDIVEEVEAVGGYLNAYTSRSQTAYYVRLLKADLELGIDILSDILLNSTFAPDELERERQVILQEIGRANDTPDEIVFDHLQDVAYPEQPMGWPILGTEESVRAISRDDLRSYMGSYYRPETIALVCAGAIDHDRLVDLAKSRLGAMTPTAGAEKIVPAAYKGGERRIDQPHEQIHLTLGFEGVSVTDKDYFVSWAYSDILGGGMSSRLFQEIREKRGLAYSVYSFARSYVDTGMIGIYAGTGPDQAGAVVPVIADEMRALADCVDARELQRAKAQIKSGLLMGLESPMGRAETAANDLFLFGRIWTAQETIDHVDAVELEDIRRFAARLCETPKLTVAAVGPTKALPDYEAIEKCFASA